MKKLSIIIPAFNCQASLDRTLERLSRTVHHDDAEIVIVDDGSPIPIKAALLSWGEEDLRVIRHHHNYGVGTAFDTGVEASRADRLILMGADILVDYGWYAEVNRILDHRPFSMTCAICSDFNSENAPFRKDRVLHYGATIKPYHEHVYNGKVFSDILQSKWNYQEPELEWESGLADITCILGAFYFTTKQVYRAIGGWMGHRKWGGLEPMISIRAERTGVNLYVAQYVEVAHEFSRSTSTPNNYSWALYNKMMMALTMCDDRSRDLLMKALYRNGPNGYLRAAGKQIRSAKITGVLDDIKEFHKQNWVKKLLTIDI